MFSKIFGAVKILSIVDVFLDDCRTKQKLETWALVSSFCLILKILPSQLRISRFLIFLKSFYRTNRKFTLFYKILDNFHEYPQFSTLILLFFTLESSFQIKKLFLQTNHASSTFRRIPRNPSTNIKWRISQEDAKLNFSILWVQKSVKQAQPRGKKSFWLQKLRHDHWRHSCTTQHAKRYQERKTNIKNAVSPSGC